MKLVSLSTGSDGEGELSGEPVLLAKARSSSRDIPLSLIRRRRLLVLWRGTLQTHGDGMSCHMHSAGGNSSCYTTTRFLFVVVYLEAVQICARCKN